MAPDEAEAFAAAHRRQRRRQRLVPLAVLGAAALVGLVFFVRRERTVWFKGPDRPVILHIANRDPISVGRNEIFDLRLRPGTYDVTVEGAPDGLSKIRVPYALNSTLALPLTSDQCFVVAMANGLYTPPGTTPSGDVWIDQITRSGEAVILDWFAMMSRDFEMSICHLPVGKHLLDSVYVVEMVSCRLQLTSAEAQELLLERYDRCPGRD